MTSHQQIEQLKWNGQIPRKTQIMKTDSKRYKTLNICISKKIKWVINNLIKKRPGPDGFIGNSYWQTKYTTRKEDHRPILLIKIEQTTLQKPKHYKPNPAIHKQDYIPWSSGIYPRNAKLISHSKIN